MTIPEMFPENTKTMTSFGLRYLRNRVQVDAAYMHTSMRNASVDNPKPGAGEVPVNGRGMIKSSANVMGFSLSWRF